MMSKFFWGVIGAVALFAVFTAGQMFAPLHCPEGFFWGSIAVLILLPTGYFFGTCSKKKSKKVDANRYNNPQ